MSVFDFLKRKKEVKKVEPKKKAEKKIEKKVEEKKVEKKKEEKKEIKVEKKKVVKPVRKRKKISSFGYRVLISPHITEKSSILAENNKYVFKVFPRSNKIEIKRAVEEIYDVDVSSVRIIRIPKKPKRFGRQEGWKKGYKKAIVTIKPGQKIDIISA
jgi:large subunit ribosomal protein L23